MTQDRGVRVLNGLQQTGRRLLLRHFEVGVNRGDHEIEGFQNIIGVIQRAVGQDIAFNSLQDLKTRKLFVQRVDLPLLLEKLFNWQSSGVNGGARMIADAEV